MILSTVSGVASTITKQPKYVIAARTFAGHFPRRANTSFLEKGIGKNVVYRRAFYISQSLTGSILQIFNMHHNRFKLGEFTLLPKASKSAHCENLFPTATPTSFTTRFHGCCMLHPAVCLLHRKIIRDKAVQWTWCVVSRRRYKTE